MIAQLNLTLEQEQKKFEEIKKSLTGEKGLLYAGRLLQRAAQKAPDVIALLYNDEEITYKKLYLQACSFARILKKRGIKKGDRILMCFENTPDFYVAYFGIWQAGGVVAPLNTFLKEVEIAHIVSDAQPVLIVTEKERVSLFEQSGAANLPPIITSEQMYGDEDASTTDESVDLDQHEVAALLYTSGTTGLPKGVMLSSFNIISCLMQGSARLEFEGSDRIFGVLPLFHVFAQFACLWGAIFVFATIILVPKIERRSILKGLIYKPTLFVGVPALYGLLCLLKTAPIDSVDFFVSGGDALSDKIRMAFALLYRRKIVSGYGLTETAPLLSVSLADISGPTSCVGNPIIGVEVEIRDEQGTTLPKNATGRIWVRGNNVMLGYYNAPEQTEKVLKNGWFDTGDLGYIDDNRFLYITGRLKDLIIHKGFNIYPQEIENVITSHPNVLRVGVIGRKGEGEFDGEEVPVAYVQIREKHPKMEEELKKLCMQQLAPYKVPKVFICSTDELATTATGKVDKKVLRKIK